MKNVPKFKLNQKVVDLEDGEIKKITDVSFEKGIRYDVEVNETWFDEGHGSGEGGVPEKRLLSLKEFKEYIKKNKKNKSKPKFKKGDYVFTKESQFYLFSDEKYIKKFYWKIVRVRRAKNGYFYSMIYDDIYEGPLPEKDLTKSNKKEYLENVQQYYSD